MRPTLALASLPLLLLLLAPSPGRGAVIVPPPKADPAANREAIQAALDKAAASAPSIVLFGEGTWTIDRPLRLDATKVTLRGLGPYLSRIRMANGVGHDVLVLGVHPRPNKEKLDPAHLPDAFKVLDVSAVPTKGRRRGFRTLGRCNLAQAGGGFDQAGPKDRAYAGVRTLLIETCLDLSRLDGKAFSLAGMRDGGPRPWSLVWYGSDPKKPNLIFSWRTRPGGDPGEGTVREAHIPVPAGLGPIVRLTICLDLDAGRLDCFFNDARAPQPGLSGPKIAPGESLASNDWNHFGLGGVGAYAMQSHDEIGGDGDVGIFGFRVGSASPYDATGSKLIRKGGQPIDDLFRYFRAGADLIALVPGTDPPAEAIAERRVTVLSGNGAAGVPTSAYALDHKHHPNPFGGVVDVVVEGLGIESSDWRYGDAVKVGAASLMRFERCEFIGGARGLACFSWGANYPVTGRDLSLSGADCSMHLFLTISSRFSDLRLGLSRGPQRALVRVIGGATVMDGVFSPLWGKPDYAIFGRRAALDLRHWALDNEGAGQGSQIADIYCWPFEDNQPNSFLVLDDFQAAQHGPGASAIILAGPPPKDNHRKLIGDATLRVNSLGIHKFSALRSIVRVLPEAEGLWRDDGVSLGRVSKWPKFEGPTLVDSAKAEKPAETSVGRSGSSR